MPKVVDTREREEAIVLAALETLAEGGFSAFTLRTIGERMGGSITLITHYFRNRAALIDGILARMFDQLDDLRRTVDTQESHQPGDVLRTILTWSLPQDDYALMLERARIAMIAHRHAHRSIDAFLDGMETATRGVFTSSIASFVVAAEREQVVDTIRCWTNGVQLSTVEHPDIWTPHRQDAAKERFIAGLLMTLDQPAPA